jgi:hypothetical protein
MFPPSKEPLPTRRRQSQGNDGLGMSYSIIKAVAAVPTLVMSWFSSMGEERWIHSVAIARLPVNSGVAYGLLFSKTVRQLLSQAEIWGYWSSQLTFVPTTLYFRCLTMCRVQMYVLAIL